MNIEQKLNEIVTALDELKVPHLVMGGHAVRYYGFHRETTDHDLHIPVEVGQQLTEILSHTSLFVGNLPAEAPTWRGGDDFRRFVLGTLPDGKEELLEFWIKNHLLEDFASLYQRREEGIYGTRTVSFLALSDLIRSKETEREDDWSDIKILEEILDQRNFAVAKKGGDVVLALSRMRSVRGLELATSAGLLANQETTKAALRAALHPATQAFLLPFAPDLESEIQASDFIPPPFRKHLQIVEPASPRHLTLVEAVRLRYKRARQELDRGEKEKHRKKMQEES